MPHQTVLRLELLGEIQRVVDERKARGAAAAEVVPGGRAHVSGAKRAEKRREMSGSQCEGDNLVYLSKLDLNVFFWYDAPMG